MDLSAIFPDAVLNLEPFFYFRERIAIQRAFFNSAGGQILP